jgi:hypothetical protein
VPYSAPGEAVTRHCNTQVWVCTAVNCEHEHEARGTRFQSMQTSCAGAENWGDGNFFDVNATIKGRAGLPGRWQGCSRQPACLVRAAPDLPPTPDLMTQAHP